jgi:DNA-binding beta-propeller fold protein YncE
VRRQFLGHARPGPSRTEGDLSLPISLIPWTNYARIVGRRSFLLVATHVLVASCACSPRTSEGGEETPSKPRFLLEWGQQGSADGEFDFPIGIAINRADEVFVTDFKNSRVQKFSAEGKFLSAFAVSPFPGGIAVSHDGDVFIAHFGIPPSRYDEERKRDKIAVFSPSGVPLREWGKFGSGDGEFDLPGGIVISPDGRVYVADQCNRRIQVFDTEGKFLTKWGRKGFQPGEFGGNPHPKAFFAGPTFLARDPAGNIFTTEGPLCRVQKFSSEGAALLCWGDPEDAPGKFGGYFTAFGSENMRGPTGICFDAQGRLWTNSLSGRIQQFSETGEFLSGFGEEGTEPGQFYAPHGLAIDSHGHLYVVDAFDHRIQKFDVVQP